MAQRPSTSAWASSPPVTTTRARRSPSDFSPPGEMAANGPGRHRREIPMRSAGRDERQAGVGEALEFPVLLRLIDERSVAFRAAAMSAPSLELKVPTCPEWTLLDLVQHLGSVHRTWAAAVGAGPAAHPPAEPAAEGARTPPREREPLLDWSAASAAQR